MTSYDLTFSNILTKMTLFFIASLLFCLQAWANSPAPSFELAGHDGKNYSLSQFSGKYVVLEWYNDGCPYVRKHYDSGNMQRLQKRYNANDKVVWLTIVSSAPGKQGHSDKKRATQIREKESMNSTVTLLDPTGKVGKAYQAKTTPHMFIISPNKEIVYSGAIDSKPSSRSSDIANAKNYVAQALDEVLSGKAISIARTKAYGCSVKY